MSKAIAPVFTTCREMAAHVRTLQRSGARVAVVPTMGALHQGHLSLVAAAAKMCDHVIATIFVNPTQFGPQEDYAVYPRTLDDDLQQLAGLGVAGVFVPEVDEIYPPGCTTAVQPPQVAERWEGECRPGHFGGVATVVLKLFHAVPADLAFFGQKDYQQTLVIRHMVRDLCIPIGIEVCPTVREAGGLAMSSRNRYLAPAEHRRALALSQALRRAEELVAGGTTVGSQLVAEMQAVLQQAEVSEIDYVVIADAETLEPLAGAFSQPAVALIAARVGTTRLIDNCLLSP